MQLNHLWKFVFAHDSSNLENFSFSTCVSVGSVSFKN